MAGTTRDTVKDIMAEIFQIEPSSIHGKTEYGMIGQWDSQNHVRLILALEEEFNVSFDVSEIEEMTTFDKVSSMLEKKL